MRVAGIVATLALVVAGCGCGSNSVQQAVVEASTRAEPGLQVAVAAPGRVEGASEVIEVGAGADGVVRWIGVKEGDHVRKGQKLAEIDCPELPAALREAEAKVEAAIQAKARLLRGSRDEQRRAAEQRTAAALAVREQANLHLNRIADLHRGEVISKAELDAAKRDFEVAEARLTEARRDEELVKSPPLVEEVAKAEAEVEAARQQVVVAGQKMSRCVVEAPISGSVLRVKMRVGETFSTLARVPLLELADVSTKRVRAEVDEKDVDRVRLGQQVWVSTDSDRETKFPGTVTSIAGIMGRRRILTGDPAEKSDRDVLEVVVGLGRGAESLPVGLRVVLQFAP